MYVCIVFTFLYVFNKVTLRRLFKLQFISKKFIFNKIRKHTPTSTKNISRFKLKHLQPSSLKKNFYIRVFKASIFKHTLETIYYDYFHSKFLCKMNIKFQPFFRIYPLWFKCLSFDEFFTISRQQTLFETRIF